MYTSTHVYSYTIKKTIQLTALEKFIYSHRVEEEMALH